MELRLLTVQPADKLLYPLSPVIYSRAAQCIEQDIELIRTISGKGLFFWGVFFIYASVLACLKQGTCY